MSHQTILWIAFAALLPVAVSLGAVVGILLIAALVSVLWPPEKNLILDK